MGSGILPDGIVQRIEFYEQRAANWVIQAAALGITPAKATQLVTLTGAARTKYQDQQAAKTALKGATADLHSSSGAMMNLGSEVIKEIKAKAASDGNQIYTLAGLPIPSTPSPVARPGTPTDLQCLLVPGDGSLLLSWRCSNPANAVGVVYQVARKLAGESDFTPIGIAGERKIADSSLPMGSGLIGYRITAVRTTSIGLPATFYVQLGVTGAGTMTANVVTPKLAA